MSSYQREILLILVIKLVLIILLRQLFFSNPTSNHLTPDAVSHAIVGDASVLFDSLFQPRKL